jgi:hypothetical protein
VAALAASRGSGSSSYTFVSAPNLHPPKLQVLKRTAGLAQGDFLASAFGAGRPGSSSQSGPLILNSKVQPVWFHNARRPPLDFEQETYNGQPVLVWIGPASVDVVNEHYRTVATVRSHGAWQIDGHDASIIGNDIWVAVVRMVSGQNLTAYGGHSNGSVIDCGLQEYDLKTGHLLKTWDALNPGGKPNVPLSASEVSAKFRLKGNRGPRQWDPYHLNAVQALPNGDLLVSMRDTWAVYLINPVSKRIIWTLGGKYSSFKVGSGAGFAWQHDAKLVNPATGGEGTAVELTLFNDNNGGGGHQPSAGMVLSLNTIARQATLVMAYHHYPPLSAGILGSMQLLPNGNALVGWGAEPYFTEYSRSGRELLDVRYPSAGGSYRTLFTDTWVGKPDYPPRGAARGKTVYASWNGATQVAKWEVLAGSSASKLRVAASHQSTGFETAINLPKTYGAYEVRALSASGHVLGTSKPFS